MKTGRLRAKAHAAGHLGLHWDGHKIRHGCDQREPRALARPADLN